MLEVASRQCGRANHIRFFYALMIELSQYADVLVSVDFKYHVDSVENNPKSVLPCFNPMGAKHRSEAKRPTRPFL